MDTTAPIEHTPENVLVIMSDEHQARALGCAGHTIAQTPNLDALAASGTRFTQAWTPSPICVPARASLATGRWVHEVGAWDSAQAYTGEPEGWAHVLRSRGYSVASFGKLHHRSAADDDGFTERHHPMFIAGGTGWVQGLPRRDPLPYPEAAELAAEVGSGHTTYTRYDDRVVASAVDWLGQRGSEPWCAFVSLVAPHYPLSAPDEFTGMYPLGDVPDPEIAVQAIAHPAVQAMAEFFNYHGSFDADLLRRGRQAYLALISWMDHNVGRVLTALDASGLRESTRIIYTSDHGEMAGNRGLWCKSFMYRDSVDVPMIVSGRGVAEGAVCSTNVNLTNVCDTVLGAVDGDSADSLVSIAADPDPERLGFSEYHDGGSITGSFAVRVGQWKYIEHVGHPPQLFDVDSDPDELVDLGQRGGLESVRARCADALRSIVNPEVADATAFVSQAALLESLGGRDAVNHAFRFNHTPTPD